MYRVLFLIIFFGYLVLNLNAQIRQLASFRITLPNTSGAQFFGHNSGLHRLFVEFEDEMPMSISLYRGADSHDSNVDHIADEFYDLKFEEDRCLLKKNMDK